MQATGSDAGECEVIPSSVSDDQEINETMARPPERFACPGCGAVMRVAQSWTEWTCWSCRSAIQRTL